MIKNCFFILPFLLCSCEYIKPKQEPQSIARVGESYLYKNDIATLVPAGISKEDSVLLVRDYINRWATQKLLIEAAERNLSDTKKEEYNSLVKQYEIYLYTKAYLEELVKTSIDTVISQDELRKYYNENKDNFKISGSLFRLRYVNFSKDNPKSSQFKKIFFNYSQKDKNFWKENEIQLKSYAFNDSVWVDLNQVYSKLPFVNNENKNDYLTSGKMFEKEFQDEIYLVKTLNVLGSNQVCPYEYIQPTLKELVLNKRKLEFTKKIEKDIADDAIKNKEYEIYK